MFPVLQAAELVKCLQKCHHETKNTAYGKILLIQNVKDAKIPIIKHNQSNRKLKAKKKRFLQISPIGAVFFEKQL